MAKINVLSIDGGGIRGIIPAMILDYIYKTINMPTHKTFNLISGTSTGGIIAMGITRPNDKGENKYTPDDMVNLYEKEGEKIFQKRSYFSEILELIEEKYDIKALKNVMDHYFEKTYLSQTLTDVIIPSYDMKNGEPYFFKTSKAKENRKKDFLVSDICCATAAAPTYFEPYSLNGKVFIDGGIFANNPSMCAMAEICKGNLKMEETLLVSIGTGDRIKKYTYEEVKNWGMINWVRPAINISINGNVQTADYELNQMLNKKNKSYYRLQVELDEKSIDMDNSSKENIARLKNITKKYIEENKDMLDEICTKLINKERC
ncbi:MAG: hypothetical protein A2Y22_03900 [Clostridiales bacterium GWD2_32_59]|nr:MAG: hypothetical protein A2Y22_03900 [Clostridiales bacterium GWD2_32_59]